MVYSTVPGTRQCWFKNLLFWLRLAAYRHVNVDQALNGYLVHTAEHILYFEVGFRVALLAEHECLTVTSLKKKKKKKKNSA